MQINRSKGNVYAAVSDSVPNEDNVFDEITLDIQDRASLLLFKSQLHDPNQRLSWVGSSYSNWTGVSCSRWNGRVLPLNLTGFNLSGQLHSSLCKLSFLETLRALEHLNLSFNHLTYEISPRFGFSNRLVVLDLSYNQLSGYIIKERVCVFE
ncbi:hypothetical protein L2E82_39235 [Cichorium intybus]|uniref:Uncharacterized protein n=1 Tax=Cichorium intybus TaxID=13427 RepID=A0ACB9AJD2_CICIN|nr:hypothetical protein L2E82_39235 [Cichorium intybus]